jgi:hypothetical protein
MSFKSITLTVATIGVGLALPGAALGAPVAGDTTYYANAQAGSADDSSDLGANYSSVNAITGNSGDASDSHGAYYSSVNAITGNSGDASDSGGRVAAGLAHRTPTELAQSTAGSQSALALRRDGSQAEPFVANVGASAPAASSGDGFDWESAAVGAGVAIAMMALGGAALIAVRRHRPRPVSASAS